MADILPPPDPSVPSRRARRRPRGAKPASSSEPPSTSIPTAAAASGADLAAIPERLIIGRVAAAHGRRGAFRMAIITNHPEHLPTLRTVYLGDEGEPRRVGRIQLRGDGKEAVVSLAGLTTAEEAAAHRGQRVWIDRADAMPLPEGEYYHYQLLGLEVVDLTGTVLGRLVEIIETGANDVYVVRGPGGEVLLPAIGEVVREIDPEAGRMIVKVPEYY